jgi:transcriptional regulator with XRE-family HTH domain
MSHVRLRKDKEPRTELGQRLRALRLERNLQQKELAVNARVHPMQYGRYERGDTMPTAEVLRRLATALGVSGDYLLEGTDATAARAHFEDRELLQLFQEIAQLSTKETVKSVLDAIVVRKKLQSLTGA